MIINCQNITIIKKTVLGILQEDIPWSVYRDFNPNEKDFYNEKVFCLVNYFPYLVVKTIQKYPKIKRSYGIVIDKNYYVWKDNEHARDKLYNDLIANINNNKIIDSNDYE